MSRKHVLFLDADPTGGTFSIDEEFRRIEAELGGFGEEINARLLERESGLANDILFADDTRTRPLARAQAPATYKAPPRSTSSLAIRTGTPTG